MITAINPHVEKLVDLLLKYEDSIIFEESSRKQMNLYLKIDRYINKHNVTFEEQKKALEEVGAASLMSVLSDWYEDLMYRMESK